MRFTLTITYVSRKTNKTIVTELDAGGSNWEFILGNIFNILPSLSFHSDIKQIESISITKI